MCIANNARLHAATWLVLQQLVVQLQVINDTCGIMLGKLGTEEMNLITWHVHKSLVRQNAAAASCTNVESSARSLLGKLDCEDSNQLWHNDPQN